MFQIIVKIAEIFVSHLKRLVSCLEITKHINYIALILTKTQQQLFFKVKLYCNRYYFHMST